MKKKSKLCLYVFLVCAFVALGVVGYFILKPHSDEVRVGTKKFVTFTSLSNAATYNVCVDNVANSQSVNCSVSSEDADANNSQNFHVQVFEQNIPLATETYTKTVLKKNSNSNKINCKISNYKVLFHNQSKEISIPDQILNDVEKDFFCCAVREYFASIFSKDGTYSITATPFDENGNEILSIDNQSLVQTKEFVFRATTEEEFLVREKFYYNGEWCDFVVENKDELNTLVWWAILYRQAQNEDLTFFVKTRTINPGNINNLVISAINSYPEYDALREKYVYGTMKGDIACLTNFEYYLNENFLLTYEDLEAKDRTFDKRNYATALKSIVEIDQNYSQQYICIDDDEQRNFAIDQAQDEVVVYNTEQLFMVVQSGAKPIFVDEKSDVAKQVYQNAIATLKQINNSNQLSQYQKVLNIHNYVCGQIAYDYVTYAYMELTNDYSIESFGNFSCFYLEGVFFDFGNSQHYAVCDGLSKAFSLLCNIEGIECVKINGEVDGGNHAWNRVFLQDEDQQLDGYYYVDTTWSEGNYSESNHNYQLLTHTYFLFKQDNSQRIITYPENAEQSNPSSQYDFYKHTFFEFDNTSNDLFVESDDELQNAFAFAQSMLNQTNNYVLEVEMSDEYASQEDGKIFELIHLQTQHNSTSSAIKTIQKSIVQLQSHYFLDPIQFIKNKNKIEELQSQLLSEQELLETIKSEISVWFSNMGTNSNWEWLSADNVFIFRFFH